MGTSTEEIKARLNIVEVVGQYVRLNKAGVHYKANCPFHQEKTPSFMVNEERGMWHCFGCGKGGDIFAFVMEMEGLEFKEALRLLADRAGVELPKYRNDVGENEGKNRGYEILELATKFYEKQLWESTGGKKILEYLHNRGLTDDSIRAFRLGFAPEGWDHLGNFLVKNGFNARELEDVGLSLAGKEGRGHYDRFRDRIMFPIMDILGRVIGYSTRVAPGGDESQAKYINTPETGIYHKSRALYGIQLAKQPMKEANLAVMVEGNMDVIAMHQVGLKNTVAVSGTALTVEQLSFIRRYGKTVRLFFDMDSAGQAAAWKSAKLALQEGLTVEIVGLPFGKDAADMGKDDPEKLREAVKTAKPALGYFLESLIQKHDPKSPEGKRAIAESYAELLAVTNELERGYWIKEVAQTLDAPERTIREVVERLSREEKRGNTFGETKPAKPFLPKTLSRRSEVLREGIVGLMLAGSEARGKIFEQEDEEVLRFLSEHPLFFFLQNAEGDPVALIEEKSLKEDASRLLFKALEIPSLQDAEDHEREGRISEMALEYWENLSHEIHEHDHLRFLADKIQAAQKLGDKKLELELLQEFAEATRKNTTVE